jgi:acetylornithine deacetylase/succinyl-diaminopimelate desuccinylase-like protein
MRIIKFDLMVEAGKKADKQATLAYIDSLWDSWFVKGLCEFIETPNLTPMVDNEYLTNGLVEKAIQLVDDYVNKLEIVGLTRQIFQPAGMSPLVVYVVEGNGCDTNVMLYGHLDKQPWMEPWDEGLGPIKPVIRGDFLYGRGGADDGYAVFACMLAIKNLQH